MTYSWTVRCRNYRHSDLFLCFCGSKYRRVGVKFWDVVLKGTWWIIWLYYEYCYYQQSFNFSQKDLEVCRQFITSCHCISCTDNSRSWTLSNSLIRKHDDCSWYTFVALGVLLCFCHRDCWFYKLTIKCDINIMVIILMAEWRDVS